MSAHVNVIVNKVLESEITYFVSDIYITDLKYFATSFSDGGYKKGDRKYVWEIAQANNAVIATAGDWYTDNPGPVLRNGILYRNQIKYDILVMYNDGTMKTYAKGEYDKDSIKELEGEAWQIWTFGPMLLKEGQPMTKFSLPTPVAGSNPRTAIGYYEPGHYVFVTVDGRQPGYSNGLKLKDLSQLMYDLGCKVAFNLDGGASSQLAFLGEQINKPCWKRMVRDAVCIIDEPAPGEGAVPEAGN